MKESSATVRDIEPTFGPLVETCEKFGIKRTWALELAREGLIETFKLRSRRFVYIDSLKSLPLRVMEGERDGVAA
jgi:hypothetical protein